MKMTKMYDFDTINIRIIYKIISTQKTHICIFLGVKLTLTESLCHLK